MPTAAEYLGITLTDAREQWTSIIRRPWAPIGRRQVAFTPVETLLCLAASLMVNHRRYGGSTAHRAEEPVPTLAQLFRRPNSSVLAKMANLDGSRPNGAKYEIEVAARLLSSQDELARLYRAILRAARDVGVTANELPDFLHLEHDNSPLILLGQHELDSTDIEDVVHTEHPHVEDQVTELLLIAAARIGQHRFAQDVLRNHGYRCVFCGLSIKMGDRRAPRMLVASHIKPWRASEPHERLDVSNGLAACPTHDVAFDTGLLSVSEDFHINVHGSVQAAAQLDPAVRAAFGRPPMADRLLLPAGAKPPKPAYLDWHRRNIYRKTTIADG